MKIEQAAILLELARKAMLDIDGVYSINVPILRDECRFEVHVIENIFNSLNGDVVVNHEPKDIYSAQLSKNVNGITFVKLVAAKEFAELYPNYSK